MPTLAELYRPAEQKLIRARQHIHDLNVQIQSYLSRNPYRLVLVTDLLEGRKCLQVECKQQVPDDFSLVTGDAIHNLRSALDVCIWSLVGTTAKNPDAVQYPFARKKESLQANIHKREVHLAGENVAKLVEESAPYIGGNEFLDALHQLDIVDKHRSLILVGRATRITGNQINAIFPEIPISGDGTLIFTGSDDVLFQVKFPRPSRHERRSNKTYKPQRNELEVLPDIEIVFGPTEALSGRPVLSLLNKVSTHVEDICISLCRAYVG